MARACPWCSAEAADDAATCAACGAALAQRESIGDLVIPGVTTVDPALKDLDGQPLRLRGPSPSHGVASGVIAAAAAGGPIGLVAIGGIAAVAAVEYANATRGPNGAPIDLDAVGRPSEAVLRALEREGGAPADQGPGDAVAADPSASDPPPSDPWSDLPPQPRGVEGP